MYDRQNSWSAGRVRWALDNLALIDGDAQSKALAQAAPEGVDRHRHCCGGSWQDVAGTVADVRSAVCGLPEQQQQALVRERAGQSIGEIARAMTISKRAVRRHLKRARRNVEKMLVG